MNSKNMPFAIFFDDGGVLNDNNLRGPQWRKFCGEFFHSEFGGDPKMWAEANQKIMAALLEPEHPLWNESNKNYDDHLTFSKSFNSEWVKGMFKEAGRSVPPKNDHERIHDAAAEYVWPKVHSEIPGIIESIKILHSRGFTIYTSTALPSFEIKLVLEAMGIKQFFSGFYGPDLINTRKRKPEFFEKIFKKVGIEPSRAIVIEDRPIFIENALNTGAYVIQACATGEYPIQYPFYVEKMNELPDIIDNLLETLKV